PDHFLAEDSVPVIEQCCRQTLDAPKFLLQILGCDCERIAGADFLSKNEGIFRVLHGVKLESDDSEPPGAVAVKEPLVSRHLLPAGLAPGGPEINQHHFATEVSRGNLSSLEVLHVELGQVGAYFARRD